MVDVGAMGFGGPTKNLEASGRLPLWPKCLSVEVCSAVGWFIMSSADGVPWKSAGSHSKFKRAAVYQRWPGSGAGWSFRAARWVTCGGEWVGVVQVLAGCGVSCVLPMLLNGIFYFGLFNCSNPPEFSPKCSLGCKTMVGWGQRKAELKRGGVRLNGASELKLLSVRSAGYMVGESALQRTSGVHGSRRA